MELQPGNNNPITAITPNNPEKEIPMKPDKNPDPTKPKPGGNEPNKIDPTRIEEPKKIDPTRINRNAAPSRSYKWTKVKGWDEARIKIKEALEK